MMIPLSEAAKLFSCSVEGLKDMIRRGLPAVKQSQKGNGRGGAPRLVVDPEVCRNWMIENKVRTFMKSEVKHTEPSANLPKVGFSDVKPQVKEPVQVNVTPGLDGAVDRLRAIELRAFSDYVRARNAGDVLGQRNYMKLHSEAVKRMLDAEDVIEQRKAIEAAVWSKVEQDLTAWAAPVRALVEQMPRSLASRCNVTDPSAAEAALRDFVTTQLFPMMGRSPKR
jgi:hypothetical protein